MIPMRYDQGMRNRSLGKPTQEREIVEATATRAVYGMDPPELEFTFKTSHGEVITLSLPFQVATDFINQALTAHSVAAPRIKPIRYS